MPGDPVELVKDETGEDSEDENSDGEQIKANSELDFLTLKAKFDSYGVAVRAGSLTPQKSDEEAFRKEAGLPDMGQAVSDAWELDGGYRRPITLKSGSESEAEIQISESQTDETQTEENN